MRALAALVGWVVLVAALAACVSRGGHSGDAARDDFAAVAAQPWRIVELSGAPIEPADAVLELHFDVANAAASGRSGVNSFSGTFARDGASLRFGPLAVTRMAGPPARMELETKVLAALDATRGWRSAERELALLAADGNVIARCEPLVR
ncbi:MAG: META domain-containing protein [Planctomycetes bacterium]|nr:META domain-containing protein [Planctomycetota bacterium]